MHFRLLGSSVISPKEEVEAFTPHSWLKDAIVGEVRGEGGAVLVFSLFLDYARSRWTPIITESPRPGNEYDGWGEVSHLHDNGNI